MEAWRRSGVEPLAGQSVANASMSEMVRSWPFEAVRLVLTIATGQAREIAVYIANDVPGRRACSVGARRVCIDMPVGEAQETVALMFEILGWQVDRPDADGRPPGDNRLVLRTDGGVVRVVTEDDALAVALARHGLDRLTVPVALPALEQLMVFAG